MKTWNDCSRVDLRGIPFMESHGFTTIFSHNDLINERITPDNVPVEDVGFIKGNIRVWKNYRYVDNPDSKYGIRNVETYFIVAQLVDNRFIGHTSCDTLEEVVEISKLLNNG